MDTLIFVTPECLSFWDGWSFPEQSAESLHRCCNTEALKIHNKTSQQERLLHFCREQEVSRVSHSLMDKFTPKKRNFRCPTCETRMSDQKCATCGYARGEM